MKKDNKGFTLIEMIIAIFIFVVVISLGYGIINKSIASTGTNKVITEGQSSANLINKYLTKDLERAKPSGFVNPTPSEINSGSYSYILTMDGFTENGQSIGYIKYIVDVNNSKYNVTRKTYLNQSDMNNNVSNSNIKIISNQPVGEEREPFIISNLSDNNNIYNVFMTYKDKSTKEYNFNVSYRHNEFVVTGGDLGDGTPERPLPPDPEPEIDSSMKDMNGFIRFGYKHESNPIKKNAYTSVGSSKVTANPEKEYQRINIIDNKNQYSIYSELTFNNSNRKCLARIETGKSNTIERQELDFGMLSINSINVTVVEDIECTLTINQKVGGQSTDLYKDINLNKPGKYTFLVEDTSANGKDIVISGNIKKPSDGTFGEIVITFGTKK